MRKEGMKGRKKQNDMVIKELKQTKSLKTFYAFVVDRLIVCVIKHVWGVPELLGFDEISIDQLNNL